MLIISISNILGLDKGFYGSKLSLEHLKSLLSRIKNHAQF